MIVRRFSASSGTAAPPAALEYGYYASVVYAVMGPALGLSLSFVGAAWLAALTAYCLLRDGPQSLDLYRPIGWVLASAAVFIAVQLLVHGESLMDPGLRSMATWMMGLIVVQCLIQRKGFFHRFALVILLIAVAALPFLRFEFHRAGLDRAVGFANANDLAAWFGFCAVYFSVAGIESKVNWLRAALWAVALGCLFVVALTVSRGPLFAVAVALLIAFRRLVKRGFVPILLMMLLAWGAYESGLFTESATRYQARFGQETGRLMVWPHVIERMVNAPLAGVGVSEIATFIPFKNVPITPHNGFLFMGLASGIAPLILFAVYWAQVARGALAARGNPSADSAFQLPIVAYAFLITMQLSTPFMAAWMMVATLHAIAAGARLRGDRYVLRRVSAEKLSAQPGKWVKAGNLLRPTNGRASGM